MSSTIKRAEKRAAVVCLAFALLLAGCGHSTPKEPAKEYPMRGEVMAIDASGHVATIKHAEIKGLMGAMTMGYPVKDAAELGKLSVGEQITATVYVSPDEMWLGNIHEVSSPPK
jgi:Cu/Ag efflux protein CusF